MLSPTFLAVLAAVPALGMPSAMAGDALWARETGGVITSEVNSQIAEMLKNSTVPGYAVALVQLGANETVEYAAWGNRTEGGDVVKSDVRASYSHSVLGTSLTLLRIL